MSEKNESLEKMVPDRGKVIVRTSFVGIAVNVLLAAFKAAVGVLSNSIAVILDAVNNLSDALSSVITIIGAKLGAKLPDKKHPLGYGRIEYLSSMLVAALVLYAGITSLTESVKSIIDPMTPDYSTVSLVIIAVAVAVKLFLGSYFKKKGSEVNSSALTASGSDASFDAVLSRSTLVCAGIFLLFGLSLEPYLGVVISLVIIKAGFGMMSETLSDILGGRTDRETASEIKDILNREEQVMGAHDLITYNYGPERNYATVHLELPDTMTVDEVDVLTRKLQAKVYRQTGIILTGVGVYSYNTQDDEAARMRDAVRDRILSHEWVLDMHGFHADTHNRTLRLDAVLSFDIARKERVSILNSEICRMYPDYDVMIIPDIDAAG